MPLASRRVGLAHVLAIVALLAAVGPQPLLAVTKPDLVTMTVSDPPATALPGDSFVVTATIANQSPIDAPASTTGFYLVAVGSSIRKNLKGSLEVEPLAAGTSATPDAVTIAVYSDTVPGTYLLQACADGGDLIPEAVENNNCWTTTATITIQQPPNLVVTSIGNPPSSAPQAGQITVKNTVQNDGPVPAGPSITKYYLISTDDGSKTSLKGPLQPTSNVPALDPEERFNETETVTVRADTVPGAYRLQACADGGKLLPEEDETDNCLTSTGIIKVLAQADLVVSSVTVQGAPLTVVPGDSIAVSAVVANQGLAPANSSALKFVLVDTVTSGTKNLKGSQTVGSLAAGDSTTSNTTVEIYSDTLGGTYQVQVCADSGKDISETLESNNCTTADALVTVQAATQGHVDLGVTAVTSPPLTVYPGQSFAVTATVVNQGIDPASSSTTSFYLVGDTKKNLKPIQGQTIEQPLAPNTSIDQVVTLEVYSDTVPGTYTLQACADGPRAISEDNENNNCANAAGTITVLRAPNLVVNGIQSPPPSAIIGQKFVAKNSVKNVGPVPAAASRTKYYLVASNDGTRQDLKGPSTATVPALERNQSFNEQETVKIRPTTLAGQYRLQACADGGKEVIETKEDDNCRTSSGTIRVLERPDLVMTKIKVPDAPLTVPLGGSITVKTFVENQGPGPAPSSKLRIFLVDPITKLSKDLKGHPEVPAIASGSQNTMLGTVTVFLDTLPGTYNIRACADYDEAVPEMNEDNNCALSGSGGTVTITAQ